MTTNKILDEKCKCGALIIETIITVPGFGNGSKKVRKCSDNSCMVLRTEERKKMLSAHGFGSK